MHGDDHSRKQFRGIDISGQSHRDRPEQGDKTYQGEQEIEYDLAPGPEPPVQQGIPDGGQYAPNEARRYDFHGRNYPGEIRFIDRVIYPGIDDPGNPCQQARNNSQC